MTATTKHTSPAHGNRTLPQTLDDLAASSPHRLYASISKGNNLADGFMDVTCADMAKYVDLMARWIITCVGTSDDFETLAYMGTPDLRSAAVFLGAVKCGYKVLLPPPGHPPVTTISLMQQTQCTKILHSAEVLPAIEALTSEYDDIACLEIPSWEAMLESNPAPYPFGKSFSEAQNDPVVVLYSSGPAGLPRPVTMTHASFAALDRERRFPTTPGRPNRDYSIWDFNGGGRFYTVFPYFHLAGFLCLLVNPIFMEESSPVLGPPQVPPSGELLKFVLQRQSLRAVYVPPAIVEQLLQEADGAQLFKDLDFVCYTGGTFSPAAEAVLSQVTKLIGL